MRAWVIGIALMAAPLAAAAAQIPDSLPTEVTPQMIRNGQLLFEGPGFCTSCHGKDGAGLGDPRKDLTDSIWHHSDGSFEGILTQIKAGVPAEHSASGERMPERGASRLMDNQLRAVAAYVWSLSRRPTP